MPRNDFNKSAQVGETVPDTPADDIYVTPSTSISPTVVDDGKKEPMDNEETGRTMIVGTLGKIEPVVGWLVCVKGATKGKDYRLHAGFNVVGRGEHCDVRIEDPFAGKNGSFRVAYDARGKLFYVTPAERATNIAYHNGKPIFESQKLDVLDTLSIGETDLRFVPFCGENMTWEE